MEKLEELINRDLDFLIENEIILELKTVDLIHKKHYAQVRSYLKATNKNIGLLINFADFKLDIRRIENNDEISD